MRPRGAAIALVVVALALGSTAPALASTPVGQTFAPGSVSCMSGFTFLQTSAGSSAPYAVPSAGVITSWSFQADASPPALKLKVGRHLSGSDFQIVGESSLQTPAANALSTFATRIPVQPGDVLGDFLTSDGHCGNVSTGNAADVVGFVQNDIGPGGSATFMAAPNARLDLSVQLEADADLDGFGDETQDGCFTDPSTHAACPPPTVSGTAQDGQTLAAALNGSPTNPSLQWLRCDSAGSNCAQISGATGASYTLTTADVGHTMRALKLASNSSGTQQAVSTQTAGVQPGPPTLTNVSQSHRRWRLGGKLARFAAATTPPVGTTFRFTLNEGARVRFAFAQLLPGRRVNGRCVVPTAANRTHKECTRSVPRGSLSFSAGAGLHKLFFQGRLTRTRKLKPGTYRLTITATNLAGQRATKTLRSFTIVPG